METDEHLDHDKLAVLMITQSEAEAHIVRGLLEEAGIHCALLTPVPHDIFPFTVDGLATIKVKVLDSQLEAAQEVLRDYQSQDGDAEDTVSGEDPDPESAGP
jgi:hypothetical protein